MPSRGSVGEPASAAAYGADKDSDVCRLPRRLLVQPSAYTLLSVTYDDAFWVHRPTKHGGTPLEVIASAGEVGEWEQITRPQRLAQITPEKLEVGARYRKLQQRIRSLSEWGAKLNEALFLSIIYCDVLPEAPPIGEKLVSVEINGRRYPFIVNPSYGQHQADYDHWPLPGDLDTITLPESWSLDDSLIGKSRNVVRTRHGEPERKIRSRKSSSFEGNIWIYGNIGVAFESDNVVALLDSDEVARLREDCK